MWPPSTVATLGLGKLLSFQSTKRRVVKKGKNYCFVITNVIIIELASTALLVYCVIFINWPAGFTISDVSLTLLPYWHCYKTVN